MRESRGPAELLIQRGFLAALLLLFVGVCQADEFPSKPLTIVVPYGVGGSNDRLTRMIAPYLAAELGQPIQVINKKGSGTLLGTNYMLRQPDDGYTILAASFIPTLSTSILSGNADYTIDDFAFINLQWFDEELIAVNKDSQYGSLQDILEAIRTQPKTVRASVSRNSAGHLTVKLLLDLAGIPQENLNLVTYSSGGAARAAVAGGVVDFIVISAPGTEAIREYVRPLAIVADRYSEDWGVPPLNEALVQVGIRAPLLSGSIRGFAMSAEFRREHPNRFNTIVAAFERMLGNIELQQKLDNVRIGRRWTGPVESEELIKANHELFVKYSHLLEN